MISRSNVKLRELLDRIGEGIRYTSRIAIGMSLLAGSACVSGPRAALVPDVRPEQGAPAETPGAAIHQPELRLPDAAKAQIGSGNATGDGAVEEKPKILAHDLDPSEVLYRPHPQLPDDMRSTNLHPEFAAKICIDRSGKVSRVDVLQGIPGADPSIVETLRSWRHKPQPTPVCFLIRYVFGPYYP